jgi:hypothetical protein
MSKRDHAKHNYDICNHLNLQDKLLCNDWIVTTAFYSAMHYIDHILFPCNYKGNVFNNINEAHGTLSKDSKHQSRAILVYNLLPNLAAEFKFLISECQEARYSNYLTNPAIAQKAVKFLDVIKKASDAKFSTEKN